MSKIKNGWLDQYNAGPFEQQQFGTAGVEGVKDSNTKCTSSEGLYVMSLCLCVLFVELFRSYFWYF